MGISTEYGPLRPMAIQKNWHLTIQPKFMLFAQRSLNIEYKIYSRTFSDYLRDNRTLLHYFIVDTDDEDDSVYRLKKPVPLKNVTLLAAAEDVKRLRKLKDGSKHFESIQVQNFEENDVKNNQLFTEPKSKLEKQQDAILKVIQDKRFDPKKIPDGEKGAIKIICEKDFPNIFDGSTSFDRAWQKGIHDLWRMENHNGYARRGIN